MPYVERRDGRLYYEVIDIAPPWVENPQTIVFHHGVSTNSGIWSDWVPVLADRYRIARFDMRGFGKSSVPGPGFAWSFDGLTEDLLAVLDEIGTGSVHLVGESIGGTVALVTAIRHGHRVASLTVSNGTHRGPAVRNVRGEWDIKIAREGQGSWADQMMSWRFFRDGLPDEKYRWFAREHATCSADATLRLAELLLRTDLSAEIGAIKAPTLLLSPDASPFVSVELMSDLHARLADAELQVFAHARHGLPLSHGRQCAEALRGFLERRFQHSTPG